MFECACVCACVRACVCACVRVCVRACYVSARYLGHGLTLRCHNSIIIGFIITKVQSEALGRRRPASQLGEFVRLDDLFGVGVEAVDVILN